MIIHLHEDGSEGFLYATGDLVIITDERSRYYGLVGRIYVNKHDEKDGHSSVISFVSVYNPKTKCCMEPNIPVWDLEPATETYNNCDKIINCICCKPVDEFFLNTL